MNKMGGEPETNSFLNAEQVENHSGEENTLRSEAEKALRRYFNHMGEEPVTDLHRLVISEVEIPLLELSLIHI